MTGQSVSDYTVVGSVVCKYFFKYSYVYVWKK